MPKKNPEQTQFGHSEVVAMLQRERTRTLAILGTFLGVEAGEVGEGKVTADHQAIVRILYWRIDSRDVTKVMHDEEPVIQHQPDDDKMYRGAATSPPTPFSKRVHRSILTESQRAA